MKDFVAIDVETAQGKRWSICQIGLAIIENGVLIETITELVQPPRNEYSFWNTKIHGLKEEDTLKRERLLVGPVRNDELGVIMLHLKNRG